MRECVNERELVGFVQEIERVGVLLMPSHIADVYFRRTGVVAFSGT